MSDSTKLIWGLVTGVLLLFVGLCSFTLVPAGNVGLPFFKQVHGPEMQKAEK